MPPSVAAVAVVVAGVKVIAHLASGKRVVGDALLYTMGRQGNTDSMDIAKAGLEADKRGLLEVRLHCWIDTWSFDVLKDRRCHEAPVCITFGNPEKSGACVWLWLAVRVRRSSPHTHRFVSLNM